MKMKHVNGEKRQLRQTSTVSTVANVKVTNVNMSTNVNSDKRKAEIAQLISVKQT